MCKIQSRVHLRTQQSESLQVTLQLEKPNDALEQNVFFSLNKQTQKSQISYKCVWTGFAVGLLQILSRVSTTVWIWSLQRATSSSAVWDVTLVLIDNAEGKRRGGF